jgi:capsid protein
MPMDGWRDGVKIDQFGRRIGLRDHGWELGHLHSAAFKPREVSAGEFIFLYDPERADANRGISSLAHAIANVRDLVDIMGLRESRREDATLRSAG